MDNKSKQLIGIILIVIGIGLAWLSAYKNIRVEILGVAFAAFGGRMLGESGYGKTVKDKK